MRLRHGIKDGSDCGLVFESRSEDSYRHPHPALVTTVSSFFHPRDAYESTKENTNIICLARLWLSDDRQSGGQMNGRYRILSCLLRRKTARLLLDRDVTCFCASWLKFAERRWNVRGRNYLRQDLKQGKVRNKVMKGNGKLRQGRRWHIHNTRQDKTRTRQDKASKYKTSQGMKWQDTDADNTRRQHKHSSVWPVNRD